MKNKHWIVTYIFMSISNLLTGCDVNDPLLDEMDDYYMSISGESSDISHIVEKHFPIEMSTEKALQLLVDRGYAVTEFKDNGYREWPDGVWRSYRDDAHKRSAGGFDDFDGYTAKKTYDAYRIVVSKLAVIGIHSVDGKIVRARGFIYIQGL